MTTGRINQVARPRRRRLRPAALPHGAGDDRTGPAVVSSRAAQSKPFGSGAGRTTSVPSPSASTASASPTHARTECPAGPNKPTEGCDSGASSGTSSGALPLPHEAEGTARNIRNVAFPNCDRVCCTGNRGCRRRGREPTDGTVASAVGCTEAGSLPRLAGPKPLTCRHGRTRGRRTPPESYPRKEQQGSTCGRYESGRLRGCTGCSAEHDEEIRTFCRRFQHFGAPHEGRGARSRAARLRSPHEGPRSRGGSRRTERGDRS